MQPTDLASSRLIRSLLFFLRLLDCPLIIVINGDYPFGRIAVAPLGSQDTFLVYIILWQKIYRRFKYYISSTSQKVLIEAKTDVIMV